MELPQLPAPINRFLHQTSKCQNQEDILDTTRPYIEFESKLREVFAQQPDHSSIKQNHLVPVFASDAPAVQVRARNPDQESNDVKDRYLLPLSDEDRKKNGSLATIKDLATFRTNFNVFSESSLIDLDWNNVVACGSSVVTALLPVSAPHSESKRALRAYYHQVLAPASDVDLFIYGLDEKQAVEKIKQIETSIRDSILSETTTIRTKNAITIVSEYPTRHVQIVLRLYKSVSEILTGFDVDCSCVAYDGKQVWASPRAVSAFITQINTIDLTRRSPSYENRLSKYSHRGFEVYWPALNRPRIDPTIYERSFSRVMGLARLLVLEKLPHPNDRETYLAKRREERGRPVLSWNARYRHQLPGNVKDAQPDDVAEWVEEDDVSNYHTFAVPYGPKYNAKRIEKLLFTKDLLLNAEWNRPKDRGTCLHRHPAFFGRVEDVLGDCCGYCPAPETDEDLAAAEEESKIYISGEIEFVTDDPGRQTIGSFHPLTDDDWTEMAYVGNTARLCQAIVDKDLEGVADWFESGELEEVDVNRRDHAGRTPLQLATMCSTPEVVDFLIERGARIVSRIYNGMTALHFAAYRGECDMVRALLDKSAANEEVEEEKEEARRDTRRTAAKAIGSTDDKSSVQKDESEPSRPAQEDVDDYDEGTEDESDDVTEGSFVKVSDRQNDNVVEDDEDEPDVYDINVLAWDNPLSPLHLAIIAGRLAVIKLLVKDYGADVLLPVKILSSYDRTPENAILTLILALQPPLAGAKKTIDTLLSAGAMATQADMKQISALHYAVGHANTVVLDALKSGSDPQALSKAMNFLTTDRSLYGRYNRSVDAPSLTAIRTGRPEIVESVLAMGAEPEISLEAYSAARHRAEPRSLPDAEEVKKVYHENVEQPVIVAVKMGMPDVASRLIDLGADVNVAPQDAYQFLRGYTWRQDDKSLLDIVQGRIKELQESLEDNPIEKPVAPEKLAPDDEYLKYHPETYQHWFAAHDLEHAKHIKQFQLSEYKADQNAPQPKPAKGKREKKEAVQAIITRFKSLERQLQQKAAKSFRELFPNAPKAEERNYGYTGGQRHDSSHDDPYRSQFKFYHPTVTDKNRDSYVQLFEAAWRGDTACVKELCLRKEQPLQVAVQDAAGFSPFSLGLVRGHREIASVALEIATAQYQPANNEAKYRYRLRGADDEEVYSGVSSESGFDDDRMVLKQIVDDQFTVDDITALADNVKSKISPLTMLEWDVELWRAQKGRAHDKEYPLHVVDYHIGRQQKSSWAYFHEALDHSRRFCKESLLRRAVAKNDLPLLRYILRTGMELIALKADQDDSRIYQINSKEFEQAVQQGHTDIVAEIIKVTGAAVPLQKMVQSSGVVLDEVPRYYQGLSVHGKKRKDWAERNAPRREKATESEHSPILRAIMIGNMKSVEYFLSDAPLHRYQEFVRTFHDNKRIQSLVQAEGGIDKALSNWLGTRADLALHMAVMAPSRRNGKTPLLEYILRVYPATKDAKSKAEGDTPLQLAFQLSRLTEAKALVEAGANQATRNHIGENILHTVMTSSYLADPRFLPQVFNMLEPKLIQPLLLEKCSSPQPGSLTPLALYLRSGKDETVLKIILERSEGKDLEILNGAGDYIIHTLVKQKNEQLVEFLVKYRPAMLYWENATGSTPIDVAETQYLRSLIESPPKLSTNNYHKLEAEPESHFATKSKGKDDGQKRIQEILDVSEEDLKAKSAAWRMDRLLKKLAEKYPGSRRLVSVIEANEVARRLAGEQQKQNAENRRREALYLSASRGYDDGGWDEYYDAHRPNKGEDEVSMWKKESDAGGVKWDLARWELEIMREAGRDVDENVKKEVRRKWGLQGAVIGEEPEALEAEGESLLG